MTLPGQTNGVSLFFDPIAADLGLSRGQIALAYTVGTLAGALPAPFVGRWIDRRGPRAAVGRNWYLQHGRSVSSDARPRANLRERMDAQWPEFSTGPAGSDAPALERRSGVTQGTRHTVTRCLTRRTTKRCNDCREA